ncbi:hypothetical protein G7Y89_g2743 [Cudoniella acicularis]|uniref:GPI mannosyltransferase 2 n=1 Tax=Cudoniella acicularis TaxID=354080 RepID=A0A8H4W6N8_9HELO|nr:hypothetical protein G7Y89_g2743 [Cudoniella acicularis]
MRLKSRVLGNPLRNLVGLFIFWKILLLLVACGSPGPGYDTSTSLVLLHKSDDTSALQPILQYVVNKLTRWDAIYFVQVSNRGYLFEQEWAFGWGFTRLIAFFITTLRAAGLPHYQDLEAAVAVVIAHTSHFFAVLSLFFLTKAVFPNSSSDNFAFRTAALHIISPAGMFLSAPFAESTCAFLSFAGSLIFTQSLVVEGPSTLGHDLLVMVSGVTFGIATTFRSNGILNGLLLLEEAFRSLLRLRYGFRFVTIRRLVATGLGGLSVAAGFLLPQYISYAEYCREPDVQELRPCNGGFHNNYNQDDFPSSPFGGSSATPLPGQQLFAQPQPNMMQFEQFEDAPSEGFMNNNFQPEVGLFNEGAFMQNQFLNSQPQYSPPLFNLPQAMNSNTTRPATQINARAAELKAQLLKGREARASTPPVSKTALPTRPAIHAETSSSLRGSPKTPIPAGEHREQELNINELISQYSDSKSALDASVKKTETSNLKPTVSSLPRGLAHPDPPAKSQAPSLGSPTKVTKPAINGKTSANNAAAGANNSRPTSNGSISEISEGEILEDTPKKQQPPTQPKEAKLVSNGTADQDERLSQNLRDQISKSSYNRGPRDASPPRHGPSVYAKAQAQRIHDDRHEEPSRSDRRPYEPEHKNDRKPYTEVEKDSYHRRGSRDDHRKPEPKAMAKQEEIKRPNREQKSPTIADILPHDDNLREWLEITGYHNAPYRDKILNRRRALAKLDAERKKLLADIEAEERGGLPAPLRIQTPTSMLPPPIPNKAGTDVETSLTPAKTPTDIKHDPIISNKRPYGDVEESHNGGTSAKIARTDRRIPGPRITEEEDFDSRRPRSSGFATSRRVSIDHRDHRDSSRPRYDEDRGVRGRADSRERDSSPGRRAYENRPPARSRPLDSDDRHDREESEERVKRPYEIRGGYRGRAFDPNFRGRGRGRGRGESQSHVEVKNEPAFGNKLATSKPYKDSRGFDRGGKGDTRYFIVKSFNEENVLKCINDKSIWTTQVQNGSIFKEAFETCKNVILVFSINKSRAFQGYARMESLPGSIEVPEWQKTINWESTGAFRVKWLVICSTRFHRIGHLKNAYNDNLAVLIGKDGQEIEPKCGASLIELIDEEVDEALGSWRQSGEKKHWDDY